MRITPKKFEVVNFLENPEKHQKLPVLFKIQILRVKDI